MDKGEDAEYAPKAVESVEETMHACAATSDFLPTLNSVDAMEGFAFVPKTLVQFGMSPTVTTRPLPAELHSESQKSLSHANNRMRQCHCKHSKCVKLYCECFASGAYCDGCSCVDCNNNVEHETTRKAAAESILERNPNAFKSKIATSPSSTEVDKDAARDVSEMGRHKRGCHCKKTGCLKKYCECFQANVSCSVNCRCADCKNFQGSKHRMDALSRRYFNSKTCSDHTDASIPCTVETPANSFFQNSRRRKFQEFPDSHVSNPTIKKFTQHQVNPVGDCDSFAAHSENPVSCMASSVAPGSSKFKYRSLLADVIHPVHIQEFCSLLMVASETVKFLAEKNGREKIQAKENMKTSSSEAQESKEGKTEADVQKMESDNCLSGKQIDAEELRSDDKNVQAGTEFLLERDELRCCEDKSFMVAAFLEKKKTLPLCDPEIKEANEKHIAVVAAEKNQNNCKEGQTMVSDYCLNGNRTGIINTDNSRSSGSNVQEGRHCPPEGDELMCDEDKSFIKAVYPLQNLNIGCHSSVYKQQERSMLIYVHEVLSKIINRGTEKSRILSENVEKTRISKDQRRD